MMGYACKEGEILFFGFDCALRRMLSALCGVSGEADASVVPRLCIADGEDPNAWDRCEKAAAAHRAAILIIGGDGRGTHYLPRPFLFSDFTDLLQQILEADRVSGESSPKGKCTVCRLALTSDNWASFGENRCRLSPAEAQILRLLLQNAPAPVSRETLSQVFVGKSGNGVDVYVSYLRRKLGGLTPKVGIVSVRGRGYSLVGGESIQN
jgi:DNA-binding response OmpR family regulator